MTDVIDTETVGIVAPHSYEDSKGDGLAVGSLVHISLTNASKYWDFEKRDYVSDRDFDFGDVLSLNEDGTVQIAWHAAGCGCADNDEGRKENTSDLTLSNEDEYELYHLGENNGFDQGVKANQSDLRDALGLNN